MPLMFTTGILLSSATKQEKLLMSCYGLVIFLFIEILNYVPSLSAGIKMVRNIDIFQGILIKGENSSIVTTPLWKFIWHNVQMK